jgi:hypothetical protein
MEDTLTMTDILVKNLSVARKPRSIAHCTECTEPCYPGLPRYRAQFWQGGEERNGYFHPQCVGKWIARLIREHREMLKKEGAR